MVLPLDPAGDIPPAGPDAVLARLEFLAQTYLQGVRRVVLAEIGPRPPAATRQDLVWFNTLLKTRGLPVFSVRRAGGDSKIAQKFRQHLTEEQEISGRRRFLHMAAPTDAGNATNEESQTALAQIQLCAADRDGARFAAAPVIDPLKCTGCDACIRVCPLQVLTQIKDEAGQDTYRVNPVSCDACGLCSDVCSTDAIRLKMMTKCPDGIPLQSWTCRACGVGVHQPAQRDNLGGLCSICAQTGHHKKLFQVLT